MIRRFSPTRVALFSMLAGVLLTVMPAVGDHSVPRSEPRSHPRPGARINATGQISATGGFAFVDAVIRCPRGTKLYLYATIDQDSVVVRGQDGTDDSIRCAGRPQGVQFIFGSRFRPGQALVRLYGESCYYRCFDFRERRFVTLRYGSLPVDVPV